jgi:hypothetical protein
MVKAIRRQAVTAERVAANTADTFVANQMKSLAQAFRTGQKSSREQRSKTEEEIIRKGSARRREPHHQEDAEAALKKA